MLISTKERKNTPEKGLLKGKNILLRGSKIKLKLRMTIGKETMSGKMKKPSLRSLRMLKIPKQMTLLTMLSGKFHF